MSFNNATGPDLPNITSTMQDQLSFNTLGAEQMTIDNAGNVAILNGSLTVASGLTITTNGAAISGDILETGDINFDSSADRTIKMLPTAGTASTLFIKGADQTSGVGGGGNIEIEAGMNSDELTQSGSIIIVAADTGSVNGSGGDVLIRAGNGSTGLGANSSGGNIYIVSGIGTTPGEVKVGATPSTGNITIGNATGFIIMNHVYNNANGGDRSVVINNAGQIGSLASSRRFKENIQDIPTNDAIMQLRPVVFNYIKDQYKTRQFGFIAEEVAEIFPDLVSYDEQHEPFTVKYHVLPVLLLNELKKQQLIINDLLERIKTLETKA